MKLRSRPFILRLLAMNFTTTIVFHTVSIMVRAIRGRGRRGNRGVSGRSEFSDRALKPVYEFTKVALSKASTANVQRARKKLQEFSKLHNASDPREVSSSSSVLVVNLLAQYCKFGTSEALTVNSMLAMIQGLRHVYNEHGHTLNYTCSGSNASGNPLNGNPDITNLLKCHKVYLAKYGRTELRARPMTAAIITMHARLYWYDGEVSRYRGLDVRDVLIHAAIVVGMNIGLRYDEVTKLKVESLSVLPDEIRMTIVESIKNSTVRRDYQLMEWPGNSDLRHSIMMDPKLALLTWLRTRGDQPGFIFCDVREVRHGHVIDGSKPFTAETFSKFLQLRLKSMGIGSGDALMYTGHSIKRGCVQLYRSLRLTDEYIMELIQMNGHAAFMNYTAAYNDCNPTEMPRFTSIDATITHCKKIVEEHGFDDVDQFLDRFEEVPPDMKNLTIEE